MSGDEGLMALPGSGPEGLAEFRLRVVGAARLLGGDPPQPLGPEASDHEWFEWEHSARAAAGACVREPRALPEGALDAVVGAAVLDPNPSVNRQLVAPALAFAGAVRVKRALLERLAEGTDPERTGAARAWDWSDLPLPPRRYEAWPLVREPDLAARAALSADRPRARRRLSAAPRRGSARAPVRTRRARDGPSARLPLCG
ncbi:hypothetical protein BIV57_11090 [Mangrovactinospora gilvigrisea]|uniref:Uncharacterized protein n=1 Tax=Mangrovactinospora gilvigrisea TaxID=1428644 RepID=A0A1J7BFD1_9ACTN|nr:hypothetical protein [Mangrovactinospora gilvigrisea]OIV37415.1 hypothetical protein BIV57_11090 [Mangrovactinospora gilvigrisea]